MKIKWPLNKNIVGRISACPAGYISASEQFFLKWCHLWSLVCIAGIQHPWNYKGCLLVVTGARGLETQCMCSRGVQWVLVLHQNVVNYLFEIYL
jgi:hypothetical protein